jgi:hypothetical protein
MIVLELVLELVLERTCGMPKVKCTLLPSKDTSTAALSHGSSVFTPSTTAWAKGGPWRPPFPPLNGPGIRFSPPPPLPNPTRHNKVPTTKCLSLSGPEEIEKEHELQVTRFFVIFKTADLTLIRR